MIGVEEMAFLELGRRVVQYYVVRRRQQEKRCKKMQRCKKISKRELTTKIAY